MADIFNKFCSVFSQSCPVVPTKDSNEKSWPKLKFLPLLLDPYRFFVDVFSGFLGLAFLFGCLMSLVSCLSGFHFICTLQSEVGDFHCSSSVSLYLADFILKLGIGVWFLVCYLRLISGDKLSLKLIFRPGRRFFKTFLTVVGFLSLFIFPIISFSYLASRQPNPDWRIEVTVFAFFFVLFIIPLFGLRLLSLLAESALGSSGLTWKEIWRRTSGSNLKILISLFFMLMIFVYLSGSLSGSYVGTAGAHPLYIAFMSEFIYDFLILMATAWLAGLSYSLKLFLTGEKCNE